MRFFCLFFFVATLATVVMAHKDCVQVCEASFVSTAVCGARKVGDEYVYTDFQSDCLLNNANCALRKSKFQAISKQGVGCTQLATLLGSLIHVPLTGSEEIPPSA